MFTARHNNYHPSLRLTWLSTFLLFLSITSTALGALVNVTVDDQTGDSRTGTKPTYSPAVNWIQGATCTGCLVNPDPKSAFHGTWHDSIATPGSSAYTVSYTFSGTAVYAFFILANQVPVATTSTNLSFSVDGKLEGSYTHYADVTRGYAYNVSVFSKSGLPDGQHEIVISSNAGANASLALFDYLLYTTEDDDESGSNTPVSASTSLLGSGNSSLKSAPSVPSDNIGGENNYPVTNDPDTSYSSDSDSTSSSPSLGIIIGGVSAGVAVILIILFVLLYARNRKRRGHRSLSPGRTESKLAHPQDVAASAALVDGVDCGDGGTDEVRWHSGPGLLASIRRFSTASSQQAVPGVAIIGSTAARNIQIRENRKYYYSRKVPTSPEQKNGNALASYYNVDHGMSRMSLLPQAPRSRLPTYATELPPTPPVPTSPLPPIPPAGAAEASEELEDEEDDDMLPEFMPPRHQPPTVPSSPVPSSTLEPPGLMSKWSDDSLRGSTGTGEGTNGSSGRGHRYRHLHRHHLHLHHHHSNSEGRSHSHNRPWHYIHSSSSGQQALSSSSTPTGRQSALTHAGLSPSSSPRQSPALRPKQRLSPYPTLNSNLSTERQHHWQAKQPLNVNKALPNPDGALLASRIRSNDRREHSTRPSTAPSTSTAASAPRETTRRSRSSHGRVANRYSDLGNAYPRHPYAQPQLQALGRRTESGGWTNDDVSIYVRRDASDRSPRYYI